METAPTVAASAPRRGRARSSAVAGRVLALGLVVGVVLTAGPTTNVLLSAVGAKTVSDAYSALSFADSLAAAAGLHSGSTVAVQVENHIGGAADYHVIATLGDWSTTVVLMLADGASAPVSFTLPSGMTGRLAVRLDGRPVDIGAEVVP